MNRAGTVSPVQLFVLIHRNQAPDSTGKMSTPKALEWISQTRSLLGSLFLLLPLTNSNTFLTHTHGTPCLNGSGYSAQRDDSEKRVFRSSKNTFTNTGMSPSRSSFGDTLRQFSQDCGVSHSVNPISNVTRNYDFTQGWVYLAALNLCDLA